MKVVRKNREFEFNRGIKKKTPGMNCRILLRRNAVEIDTRKEQKRTKTFMHWN